MKMLNNISQMESESDYDYFEFAMTDYLETSNLSDVLPADTVTLQNLPSRVVFLLLLYCVLFLIGLFGNVFVLVALLFRRSSTMTIRSVRNQRGLDTVRLYVITLCFADLLLIMTLPMTITDIYFRSWIFGEFGCKLYWAMDPANKVLSILVLTALSLDRYVVICNPKQFMTKCRLNTKCTTTVILILILLSFAVAYPLINSATIPVHNTINNQFEMTNLFQNDSFTNISTMNRFPKIETLKRCHQSLTMKERQYLLLFLVIFTFAIPFILISFANFNLIRKLVLQSNFESSQIPISGLVLFIMLTELFHFTCWLPYYLANLIVQFSGLSLTGNVVHYLFYIVHALPYLNSAVNWVFYAYLNKHLQSECTQMWRNVRDTVRGNKHLSTTERPDTLDSYLIVMSNQPSPNQPLNELNQRADEEETFL